MAVKQLTAAERSKVQKYLKEGCLPLSTGFLQQLFETKRQDKKVAIIQIHNVTEAKLAKVSAILTICDGTHTFGDCRVPRHLAQRLTVDRIVRVNTEDTDCYPLILVKRIGFRREGELYLEDYEMLFKCHQIPGYPLPSEKELKMIKGLPSPPVFVTVLSMKQKQFTNSTRNPRKMNPRRNEKQKSVLPPTPSPVSVSDPEHVPAPERHSPTPPTTSTVPSNLRAKPQDFPPTPAFHQMPAPLVRRPFPGVVMPFAFGCLIPPGAGLRFPMNGSKPPPPHSGPMKQKLKNKTPTPPKLDAVPLNVVVKHVGEEIDVLAIIEKVGPLEEFLNKKRAKCVRRELQLTDKTREVVSLVLWWDQAREFNAPKGDVIAVKQASVTDYNGKISITSGRGFVINPPMKEGGDLFEWYRKEPTERKVGRQLAQSTISGDVSDSSDSEKSEFIPLSEIADHLGEKIDVLAVVDCVNPVRSSGTTGSKREIQLIDTSCTIVTWTLWNDSAKQFAQVQGNAIRIKGAKVVGFNDKFSMNNGVYTKVGGGSESNDVGDLLKWYKEERKLANTTNVSNMPPDQDTNTPFTLDVISLKRISKYAGDRVDILAVADRIGSVSEFKNKVGVDCVQRIVKLVDESAKVTSLVLWSDSARTFEGEAKEGDIIGIKGSKVTEYKGSFSLTSGIRMEINPDIKGVSGLKRWYAEEWEDSDW